MYLLFDFGNTRIKCAIYKENVLQEKIYFANFNQWTGFNLLQKYKINKAIICTVTNNYQDFLTYLNNQNIQTHLFTKDTPIPIINSYTSASTLGSDRLAAAIGAFIIKPNENTLSIDIGTCIKYNFCSKYNEYLGGAISPGIDLRYKAMHNHTARLPLLNMEDNINSILGKNTAESLHIGAQIGAVAEVTQIINLYKQQYDNLNTIITGGNANYFAKHIKNNIFVEENLIFIGLNAILNKL